MRMEKFLLEKLLECEPFLLLKEELWKKFKIPLKIQSTGWVAS